MVYPILKINQDDSNDMEIVIIDTEYENELSIQDVDDIPSLFYILTDMFLSQYEHGYEMGYDEGWADGYNQGWEDGYHDEPMK